MATDGPSGSSSEASSLSGVKDPERKKPLKGRRASSKETTASSHSSQTSFTHSRVSSGGSSGGSSWESNYSTTSAPRRLSKEAQRYIARQRRGEIGQREGFYDRVDDKFEDLCTDVTRFWDKCSLQRQDSDQPMPGRADKQSSKESDPLERRFGLPEFEDLGYCISPHEDNSWPDLSVPRHLGFQIAVHGKTSIERYCLQMPKSRMPPSATKEQVQSLVRNLKRCDHANILKCHEVCEDATNVYLLYERFPCVTLLSVLEAHEWTQEQVVNLVRECCSAVAYSSTVGLNHLGWTLSHVLLPANCLKEDPKFAKLHGFGLMGTFFSDVGDFTCFAPEAMESHQRVGDSFVQRLELAQKAACDIWSLGTVIYSIIARRPPIVGSAKVLPQRILSHDWKFNLNFDDFDPEAKQLVEGLMHSQTKSRTKADAALHNPWIRRRWKPPPQGTETFDKLEEFCTSSLPKRLFGRFLVKFLDAEHMSKIAEAFYSLDMQGDGVIDAKDLHMTAKFAGRPHSAVDAITAHMCTESLPGISLTRFAESMAEEVIDGKALRHSFESLDDDGSECITADELLQALQHYSSELTQQMVLEHIAIAEGGVAEGGIESAGTGKEAAADNKLGFSEYIQLFPGRMRRVKVMEERITSTRAYAESLEELFDSVKDRVRSWIGSLDQEATTISKLVMSLDTNAGGPVNDLKRHITKVAHLLAHPPGPAESSAEMAAFHAAQKRKKKSKGRIAKHGEQTDGQYGFDSFVQDHAAHSLWLTLVEMDRKALRQAMRPDAVTGRDTIDIFKAGDAARSVVKKVEEVVEWARFQLEEYDSFVDILVNTETSMPSVAYSGRGLQQHGEEDCADSKEVRDVSDNGANSNLLTYFFPQLAGNDS